MRKLIMILSSIALLSFSECLAQDTSAALTPAETKFKELLTNATLAGRWAPLKDGELGPEKEDKYVIVSAGKVKEDNWVINAKMKYGEREIVAPIPVQVKWAGDTAVIVVDKMTVPGGGAYSARVLFYEKTYAGSWKSEKHGGLLSGTITNKTE